MSQRAFGDTGLRVSPLCLGSAWFGVAPPASEVDRLVGAALDAGVTFFDTASTYGDQSRFDRPGAPPAPERESAEELMGRALRGRRDRVVLATKVGEPIGHDGEGPSGLSAQHVERTVERSLRRLGTDRIDLLYAHHPDPERPPEEVAATFTRLIERGLVRHWGISNHNADESAAVSEAARAAGLVPPVAHQLLYNLARRGVEAELLPTLARCGQTVVAYSGVAGGLLAGATAARRRYAGRARHGGDAFSAGPLALADRLQALADEQGCRPTRLALGWLVAQPQVVATVVGPESVAELLEGADDLSATLPPELVRRVGALTEPASDLI